MKVTLNFKNLKHDEKIKILEDLNKKRFAHPYRFFREVTNLDKSYIIFYSEKEVANMSKFNYQNVYTIRFLCQTLGIVAGYEHMKF